MARRKKTSAAGDFMDLVSLLPWWGGLLLALVTNLLLHVAASQPVAVATQPGQIGASIVHTMWKSLAAICQYLVPVLCLAGAAVSAWRRKERENLLAGVVQSEAADALDGMSWRQFEMLVGEGFRRQGYSVVENGGGGADGGIDLVLSKPGKNGSEKYLVQCKQWRAFKVGVDAVRELYGVMAAKGAAGGFVVTSGRFTEEARTFANGRNVVLVDGEKLHGLLRQAGDGTNTSTGQAAAQPAEKAAETAIPSACPMCSKPMVRRTAKRGANAGCAFWGCTGYPACRGTRTIS